MFQKITAAVITICFFVFACRQGNTAAQDKIKNTEVFEEIVAAENPVQRIAIQPFGKIDTHYVRNAKNELEAFYRCNIEILPVKDLPAIAFYKPRNRYKADSLIEWLAKNKPEAIDRIIGLTEKDISTRNEPYDDWGIMGLAYCPGESCIVSTFRLKKNADQKKN